MQLIYKFIQNIPIAIAPIFGSILQIGDSFLTILQKLQGLLVNRTIRDTLTSVITSGSNTSSQVDVYTFTIPANVMFQKDVMRLNISGLVNKPYTITNNNYIFYIKINGTVVAQHQQNLSYNSVENRVFTVDALIAYRTQGASAQVAMQSVMEMPTSNSAYATMRESGLTATVNTTSTTTITFSIKFGNSSGSNRIETRNLFICKE